MLIKSLTATVTAGCISIAALGADLHVPGDYDTIQDALDAAAQFDQVLVADGAYSGAGFMNLDLLGKTLTVRSENGPDNCILDGTSTPGEHAFFLNKAEHNGAHIQGFTFNGYSTSAGSEGAIRLESSSPKIIDCIFQNCSTADAPNATTPGSAIAAIDSHPSIDDSIFRFNQGSAVYADADGGLFFGGCLFEDNVARPADGRGGAAILSEGLALVFTSTLRRNSVEAVSGPALGGAIYHTGTLIDLTTDSFRRNSVTGPGEQGGSAVYAAGDLIMNHNFVQAHKGDHEGAAILLDGVNTDQGFNGFMTGSFEGNEVGGILIIDPDLRLDVTMGSSEFCDNGPFNISGPFTVQGFFTLCCPADANGDDDVDIDDLFDVLAAWGSCGDCPADVNLDGLVDIDDVFEVLGNWGPCP